MKPLLRISAQAKMGWGAALAAAGVLLAVLGPVACLPLPLGEGGVRVALGFVAGLLAGLGTALGVAGMVERRGLGG